MHFWKNTPASFAQDGTQAIQIAAWHSDKEFLGNVTHRLAGIRIQIPAFHGLLPSCAAAELEEFHIQPAPGFSRMRLTVRQVRIPANGNQKGTLQQWFLDHGL